MYIPEGLRKRGEGPGALLVGGAAAMSLVFGAAAFGWVGVAIGVAGIVLLLLAEVYREAAGLSRERTSLREELGVAQVKARSAHELKIKNEDLEQTVDELRRKSRRPALDPGQLLLGIKVYLDQIKLVRRHRSLGSQVEDALVTKLELTQGKVTVSAICPRGSEHLDRQPIAFVDARAQQAYGGGLVVSAAAQDVRAIFDPTELPTELADDLRANGSFSPQGYVLRLLGLCFDGYQKLNDQRLKETGDVLDRAREALTTALLPQAAQDPNELLHELESGFSMDETELFGPSEEEIVALSDDQGGGS